MAHLLRPHRSSPDRSPAASRRRLAAALLVVASATALLGAPPVQPARETPRPALIVVLVVDQMRADYVDRYAHQWSHGLRRLLSGGASFGQAAYPYMNTVTCAGHATIATGAYPRAHGMILNEWWDRPTGTGVACTTDPAARPVPYDAPAGAQAPDAGGDSAWRLRVPTLADELRAQLSLAPRIVSFSLKARSAIMLAGHRADAVTWLDDADRWVTSTAFASGPVPFVQRFVAANPVARDFDKVWTRALDERAYLFEDAGVGERPPVGWSTTFPHPLAGDNGGGSAADQYTRWERSPFSDAYLGRLAEAAVDELGLGQGSGLDYLGVSFSALDRVGHPFGPTSHEVQDTLVGVDRTIGRLLDHLDRAVGPGRYVVALSADHGVSPIPEQMLAQGLSAGRIATREVVRQVEEVLEPWLGPGPHVAAIRYTDLYFRPGVYARLRDMPSALNAVIKAIRAMPGVWRVYRSEDMRDANAAISNDPILRAVALSHDPDRSGDLLVVPQPYWINSADAATHGTASLYDRHVPVVLYGAGIRPGEYLQPATPADIAPTLAFLAGVTLAAPDGRVLAEALDRPAPCRPW